MVQNKRKSQCTAIQMFDKLAVWNKRVIADKQISIHAYWRDILTILERQLAFEFEEITTSPSVEEYQLMSAEILLRTNHGVGRCSSYEPKKETEERCL